MEGFHVLNALAFIYKILIKRM